MAVGGGLMTLTLWLMVGSTRPYMCVSGAVPVIVEGRMWGALATGSPAEPRL